MTEEEKGKIIAYIRGKLTPDEASLIEKELFIDENNSDFLTSYTNIIRHIDLVYARREINIKIGEVKFSEEEEEVDKIKNKEKDSMNSKKYNWVNYLIMVAISILVSWLVFSIAFEGKSGDSVKNKETNEIQSVEVEAEDSKLVSDEESSGTDIMGIALNRTGFYLLPYSVNELKSVFGSNKSMTNNLPLTIIWDDKELGFAIATFVDENLEKLPSIPYRFSKKDYFLGEEMFLVFNSKSKVSINSGIIIEDSPEASTMLLHLNLQGEVYGAVVMDKTGTIVGLCEKQDENGNAVVNKSKEMYQMVSEMNLDKGVPYISLPSSGSFKLKSNTQRIELLSPFVAWFNSK